MAIHNDFLRGQFGSCGMIPKGGDLPTSRVEAVHEFDEKVTALVQSCKINLTFQFGKKGKRKISEEIESDPRIEAEQSRVDLF
jgi:hypothetical protein